MAESMSIISAMRTQRHRRAGVTLVEIMVVSLIISMLSAISFPAYKIIQQREKERRLRKILEQVRASISGSKSQQSNRQYVEGFRNFVRAQGLTKIRLAAKAKATADAGGDPVLEKELLSQYSKDWTKEFIIDMNTNGKGYPASPPALLNVNTYDFDVATGTNAGESVNIVINRRFLRNIPPHPFKSWNPGARWEFRPADNTSITVTADDWDGGGHHGVTDIVSRGAGIGLDGSNTDDW